MVGTIEQIIKWLFTQSKDKIFEIKEHKPKRTLTQNSYAWKLITKIGNVLRKSKEEVYWEILKDYGQSEIFSVLSEINPKGYFKYYEAIGTGIINNKEFTHYKVFKGSSEFDSKEMSIFIDGIIQECEQLNILTRPKAEIESMRLI